MDPIDICKRDPFSELTISCSDTDVILILLNYFGQSPVLPFSSQPRIGTIYIRSTNIYSTCVQSSPWIPPDHSKVPNRQVSRLYKEILLEYFY